MTSVAAKGQAVSFGLVGAGEFGATLIAQARRVPRLRLRVVCDLDLDRARSALLHAGYDEDGFAICDSRADALGAVENGRVAVLADLSLVADLPLEVIVEATGDPEGAASVAEKALASGYSTVMVTKEAEVLVGPELGQRARAAGLRHVPVEGDQPALLIALARRAQGLGLPVMAAGKSTESDYVYDPNHHTLTAWGETVAVPDYSRLFDGDGDLLSLLSARLHPKLAAATVPDLCEMGIVANYCGFEPDIPPLHAPVARTTELARIFCPRSGGGLLKGAGRVDVFACLRRPDELSFAGGVFVVVEAPDLATGALLGGKGIPASADGRYLLLHNPVHLLGVEAVASVLSARQGNGEGLHACPHLDLVGRANRDIAEGEMLMLGARHTLVPLDPLLLPATAVSPANPVPYYLAAGHRVARPIAKGSILTYDDVALDRASARYRLRLAQDRTFALESRM